MILRFDFDYEAWIKGVEVEGATLNDCKEKLRSMSIYDLLQANGTVSDAVISNYDYEVIEDTYTVRVSNIKYEVTEDDLEFSDKLSDEAIELSIKEIQESLPKDLTVEVVCGPDEIEDMTADAIYTKTDYFPESFDFEIIE